MLIALMLVSNRDATELLAPIGTHTHTHTHNCRLALHGIDNPTKNKTADLVLSFTCE